MKFDKLNLKYIERRSKNNNSQDNSKEEQEGDLLYYKLIIAESWCRSRQLDKYNRLWSPETDPHIFGKLLDEKIGSVDQRGENYPLNGAGKNII